MFVADLNVEPVEIYQPDDFARTDAMAAVSGGATNAPAGKDEFVTTKPHVNSELTGAITFMSPDIKPEL